MLILSAGGFFLVWKSAGEICRLYSHGAGQGRPTDSPPSRLALASFQIMLIGLVFSLDSIVTAVGTVNQAPVMIAAVVISALLMMTFASRIGRFITAHSTIRILALAFLLVVGNLLLAKSFGDRIPKGYVYCAMAFSLAVEPANIRLRKASTAISTAGEVPRTMRHAHTFVRGRGRPLFLVC